MLLINSVLHTTSYTISLIRVNRQNGTVERSHREDQEKFYEQNGFKNLDDLKRKLKVWNTYYNNLEHCGLGGKTPNEFLEDYKLIKPPNVLA